MNALAEPLTLPAIAMILVINTFPVIHEASPVLHPGTTHMDLTGSCMKYNVCTCRAFLFTTSYLHNAVCIKTCDHVCVHVYVHKSMHL